MTDTFDLNRFIQAQDSAYPYALKELKEGCKRSHWMWYIFPQLRGLGHSRMSNYYGISGIDEAKAYLENPILNHRLREVCEAISQIQELPKPSILFNESSLFNLIEQG